MHGSRFFKILRTMVLRLSLEEDENEVFVDQARNERREALSMILQERRSEREVSSMSVESKMNPGVN